MNINYNDITLHDLLWKLYVNRVSDSYAQKCLDTWGNLHGETFTNTYYHDYKASKN